MTLPNSMAGVEVTESIAVTPDRLKNAITALVKVPGISDIHIKCAEEIWVIVAKQSRRASEFPVMRECDITKISPVMAGEIEGVVKTILLRGSPSRPKPPEAIEADWQAILAAASTGQQQLNSTVTYLDYQLRFTIGMSLSQRDGPQLSLFVRVGRKEARPLSELGLNSTAMEAITTATTGLIVLAGPMNSGKTSTAQSIIRYLNETHHWHIVTLEDPVEMRPEAKNSYFTFQEVGSDGQVPSFVEGVRRAKRMNAQALFIGELRSGDEWAAALDAAESGLLVIATTHGRTIDATIIKAISESSAGQGELRAQMFANSTVAILRHALIPGRTPGSQYLVTDVACPNASALKDQPNAVFQALCSPQYVLKLPDACRAIGPGVASMNTELIDRVLMGHIRLEDARMSSTNRVGLEEVIRKTAGIEHINKMWATSYDTRRPTKDVIAEIRQSLAKPANSNPAEIARSEIELRNFNFLIDRAQSLLRAESNRMQPAVQEQPRAIGT